MKAKIDYTPRAAPTTHEKFAGKYTKTLKSTKTINKSSSPEYRTNKHIPSVVTPGHCTAPKIIPECTLPNLLGISIVHKSGLIPVFSTEQAKDLASMRR